MPLRLWIDISKIADCAQSTPALADEFPNAHRATAGCSRCQPDGALAATLLAIYPRYYNTFATDAPRLGSGYDGGVRRQT